MPPAAIEIVRTRGRMPAVIVIRCRIVNLVSIVGGLRSNRSLLQLSFALKFGVVQTAGIAESSRAVWTAPPFGSIDPIAAMAPSRRSRTLYHRNVSASGSFPSLCTRLQSWDKTTYAAPFLHFVKRRMLSYAVTIHGDIVVLGSGLASTIFSRPFRIDLGNEVSEVLQVLDRDNCAVDDDRDFTFGW